MERASDKHGPKTDEHMTAEVRSMLQGAPIDSRAEEMRLQEGGEAPEAVSRVDPDAGQGADPGAAPDPAAVEDRSELARHLRPSAFPADRGRLLDAARQEHAPDPIVARLSSLPDGAEYPNVEAVWEALGGRPESRA